MGFALVGIRAVAGKTFVGKYGPYVKIITHLVLCTPCAGAAGKRANDERNNNAG
jgi:hypothetical protein